MRGGRGATPGDGPAGMPNDKALTLFPHPAPPGGTSCPVPGLSIHAMHCAVPFFPATRTVRLHP